MSVDIALTDNFDLEKQNVCINILQFQIKDATLLK